MKRPVLRFATKEEGGITVLNLYFLLVMAILAGFAIDMASLVQARTQLQVAADAAAHAAIVTREYSKTDIQPPIDKAKEVAAANIPASLGSTLNDADINFGTYDPSTKEFTVDNSAIDAVHVVTDRLATNGNAVPAFLLRFVGFQNFDLRTSSVFETFYPTCLREGFVAESRVDVQSNNGFQNGFCIHSNSHVEINNGNNCDPGVIISVPGYLADFVQPTNKVTSNPGCADAVRAGSYEIKILKRLADIEAGVNDPNSPYYRTFLTSNTIVPRDLTQNNNQIEMSDFTQGRIYRLTCTKANGKISWGNAQTWREIVVITNCPVNFANSVHLEDLTLIITDTSNSSWSAPNGLTIGANDSCAAGGEAQIVTHGGVSSASGLNMFGGQIIAAKDVDFAANANGIEGASIIAGGEIDGTSNANMAFCGGGNTNHFQAAYFRLAG